MLNLISTVHDCLTLPMLRLFSEAEAKIFENHLIPVMLVFIGILHYFVLATMATSSLRVKHKRVCIDLCCYSKLSYQSTSHSFLY